MNKALITIIVFFSILILGINSYAQRIENNFYGQGDWLGATSPIRVVKRSNNKVVPVQAGDDICLSNETTCLSSAGGAIFTGTLNDISDVSTTSPTNYGSLLMWNGGAWTNTATSTLGISGGSMTYPDAGIALSTGAAWDTSIANNSGNWNTAYGWGDHTGLYDVLGQATSTLSSHTTAYNHANYDTAYGWGNHLGLYDILGQATSTLASHTTTFTHANYDTAYSWGNHSGLYLATTSINSLAEINGVVGSTLLISGGTLTTSRICRYDGTGIDCDRLEDGSGACAASSVCMGGHTHPGADEAYGAGWDADTATPEKDDVYDWGVKFDTDSDGLVNNLDTDAVDAITEIATALKDGSGDCGTGLICLGDHTHSSYLTAVPDSYLLNNGDVGTGVYDFGGADSFEIVNATGPTVNAAGEIAIDTTSDQLKYYGGAERVLTYFQEKCFHIKATSTDSNWDFYDNTALWFPRQAVTITDIYCDVGTAGSGISLVTTFSDGTNALEDVTCDADGAADDGSIANGTFTANERFEVDFGTETGDVMDITACVTYLITAD